MQETLSQTWVEHAHRLGVEQRVEGCQLVDPDALDAEDVGDLLQHLARHGRAPAAIRSAGMIAERRSGYRAAAASISARMSILVHLGDHRVEAEHGDHVGQVVGVPDTEQALEVDEGRRPHLHPGLRAAVADDVEAELALRRLDRRIDLARRHLEAVGGEVEVLDQRLHRAVDPVLVHREAIVGMSIWNGPSGIWSRHCSMTFTLSRISSTRHCQRAKQSPSSRVMTLKSSRS